MEEEEGESRKKRHDAKEDREGEEGGVENGEMIVCGCGGIDQYG